MDTQARLGPSARPARGPLKRSSLDTDIPLVHVLKDYPKEVILRDGSGVTLRPLTADDGPLLHRMVSRLPEEDRWFLGLGDCVAEIAEKRVRNSEPDRVVSIAAVLEGDMIAAAALVRGRPGAEGHVGRIQISVTPAFRERRLGTWMLLDLVNAAMSMGLERLVMYLVEGRDESVMRGVEKLLFVKEALLKAFVKDSDGEFHDLAVMVKRIPREWTGG